jgi:hypothetical protein
MSEKSKLTLHFLQRKTEEYEQLKIEIEIVLKTEKDKNPLVVLILMNTIKVY